MPDAITSFTHDIPNSIERDLEKAKAVDAVFLFRVNGDGGGIWTVNMKDTPGVTEGDSGNAECTIELSTDDWKAMTAKPGAAMQFFMQGKIKVSGNALLATKLQAVIGHPPAAR
jgi:putative sterol carrier protein